MTNFAFTDTEHGISVPELCTSTAEQRLELQTVPLLLPTTAFYVAVMCKPINGRGISPEDSRVRFSP